MRGDPLLPVALTPGPYWQNASTEESLKKIGQVQQVLIDFSCKLRKVAPGRTAGDPSSSAKGVRATGTPPRRAPKALQRALRLGRVLTLSSTTRQRPKQQKCRRRTSAPGDRFVRRFWTGFWTERVTFRRSEIMRESLLGTASNGLAAVKMPVRLGQGLGPRPGQGVCPRGRPLDEAAIELSKGGWQSDRASLATGA